MPNFYSKIAIPDFLTSLDWLVFLAACGLCVALILYGHHSKKKYQAADSATEHLIMGRQLTLPLFIATLVATWYGNIFGVTQIAFEQGIYNLVTQGFFWYVTYIFFAIFLVKKIRSYNATTLPELVHKIYGKKSARVAAILIFFKTLPITYAISIGLLLQCLFPLSLLVATSIGVTCVVLYALSGGLRTIVYSDVALFMIMCFGIGTVLLVSAFNFGGLAFLHKNLPASYFQPCGTNSLSATLVWFFIACCTTFISPAFYQRCLAAKNNAVAIKGILFSTLIWFLFDICTTFGAMYAKAVIPMADAKHAYLTYGIQLLPNGLRGLLLASIAAAIIATLDSFLFIASNILFYDLHLIKLKNIKLQSAMATIVTASITIIISMFFQGNIASVWLVCKSYFAACLLLPILFGYFAPIFASDKLFIINCIIACSSITLWRIFAMQYYPNVEGFYIGCIATTFVFGAFYFHHKFKAKLTTFSPTLS